VVVRTCDSPRHKEGTVLSAPESVRLERCRSISRALVHTGLFHPPHQDRQASNQPTASPTAVTWRISPDPFWLTGAEAEFFHALGGHLLAFYRAVNQLYHAGRKGQQTAWATRYFDQGKPDTVIDYGRMNRFKQQLPGIIRPDIIPAASSFSPGHSIPATGAGWAITELDAVPGGIGLTAALGRAYTDVGAIRESPLQQPRVIGGPNGMVDGFAAMIRSAADHVRTQTDAGAVREPPLLAIIVSEESRDYRAEMTWLAGVLNEHGLQTVCIPPDEVRFTERQLECDVNGRLRRIDVLYRFFELFDLKNIPKAELLLYAAKKGLVAMTPPPKSYLEEKLAFALLHHPALRTFWQAALPSETLTMLRALIPPTWIIDPAPVPPHAVIPGLEIEGEPVTDWEQLTRASQKGRQLIMKPSGFSPLAWGSRGVVVGHDLSQDDWADAVRQAVNGFAQTPYVLQPFISGRPYAMSYWEPESDRLVEIQGRVRLSPYYFSSDDAIRLGGVLATFCPMDKKLLHGMSEAILAPCAVRGDEAAA
jgi:hypothetical protein